MTPQHASHTRTTTYLEPVWQRRVLVAQVGDDEGEQVCGHGRRGLELVGHPGAARQRRCLVQRHVRQ